MAARRVTYREYLEWAALRPRTNDWSAFVAYDRDKCNHLLQQEYIQKFDSNAYMPPIDDTYATGETTWYWLNNYQTDVPRLSFENNPDSNGANVAEANMSMAVVGGTEIELYSGPGGGAEVTKISSFDPLDHPELTANRVSLKDIIGQVDQGGSVVLDLGDPAAQRHVWELTNSRVEHVRRMGGAYLKRKFREAEPARRTYKLGQLTYTEQEFLKPAKFKMRTVMEAGANLRSAANFGNGALELRIAMKGELEGGFPGEDWLYPLPVDRPELNSSLMLKESFLMENIIAGSLAKAFRDPDATFDVRYNNHGFVESITARQTTGGLELGWGHYYFNGAPAFPGEPSVHELRLNGFFLPMYFGATERMTITRVGGNRFRIVMGAKRGIWCDAVITLSNGNPFQMELELNAELGADFSLNIDLVAGTVGVEFIDFQSTIKTVSAKPDDVFAEWINLYTDFSRHQSTVCKEHFAQALSAAFEPIDVFVLHSLLFNSTDSVQLKTIDVPGDMISFGSISPRLTTFSIDPAEKLLGYSATHTFTTNPAVPGLKWSVSNLDGTTTDAGQIDANTGRYTAPGLSQIGGTFKRVKITATGTGSNPHVSKALVTIAARAVTLNPLVQTCSASDNQVQTRQFSANSLSGALKWTVIGGGSIPENASPDRTNVYTAPPKEDVGTTKRTFTVDEVKVINTATQQTQSSFVVVTHDKQNLVLNMELQAAGKAKFSAKFNGQSLEPTWDLFPPTDAGSIDATGVYTPSPNSPHQFVIITARATMGDFFLGDAFSIQALPLAALPAKPNPEMSQGSLDGLPQI